MLTWLLILVPLGLAVLYVAARLAIGKPPSRHGTDMVFALLLLVYFAVTVGLGIFWVARQELPPFDLHYLFGYVTMLLAVIHICLNWSRILAFFRRRSPAAMKSADGRQWRTSLRAVGWLTGLVLFAGVFFVLGARQGDRRLEIVGTESESGEPATTAPGAIGRHWIAADGQQYTLSDYYHRQTAHTRVNVAGGSGINWSLRPEPFKDYSGVRIVALPDPQPEAEMSTGEAIVACRVPVSGFHDDPISLADLATMLFMTNGITKTLDTPRGTYLLRAAPSAGALYPTAMYVAVRDVVALEPGLYYYDARDHVLREVAAGAGVCLRLASVVSEPDLVARAPVTFVFTSVFGWTNWKYNERSYRYCGLDAGHLAVQTDLAAAALGYRSRLIGRFDDVKANRVLQIDMADGTDEFGMLIMPVGLADPDAPASENRRTFATAPRSLDAPDNPLMYLVHGRTELALADSASTAAVGPERSVPPLDKPYPGAELIVLPRQATPSNDLDLFEAVNRRRSLREWTGAQMSLNSFASLLQSTCGLSPATASVGGAVADEGAADPSVEHNQALHVYVLVNAVSDIEPGVYYYHRGLHALSPIRTGDNRRYGYESTLFQDVVGDAQALLIVTVDQQRLGVPDGDRGYRYACLDAGMLGGRLYLQATALRLGACGIGAYFDEEINELVRVGAEREMVLYCLAFGVPSRGGN